MAEAADAQLIHPSRIVNRWVQLVAGIIAMMAIGTVMRYTCREKSGP